MTASGRSRRSTHTSNDAARIVSRGEQVRQRIRDLTAATLRERELRFDEVRELVDELLRGAAEGVRAAVPASRGSVLRQVFDGIGDAMAATIKATQRSIDAARQRGERLAGRDVRVMVRGVGEAEHHFLDAVWRFAGRLSGATRATLREMVDEARSAGTAIRPAAAAALKSAGQDPLALASESIQAGAVLARQATGGLMLAAGGLLSGVGSALRGPASPAPSASAPTKRSSRTTKRSPAKSAAAARSRKKKTSTRRASSAGRKRARR